MVGAAFAALLANPLTAALRGRARPRGAAEALGPLPPVPGLRVSTLTPASGRLVERAGAWRDVAPPYSAAFDTMQARSRPPARGCAHLRCSVCCALGTVQASSRCKSYRGTVVRR